MCVRVCEIIYIGPVPRVSTSNHGPSLVSANTLGWPTVLAEPVGLIHLCSFLLFFFNFFILFYLKKKKKANTLINAHQHAH